jgi:Tol biopolymer transport system component
MHYEDRLSIINPDGTGLQKVVDKIAGGHLIDWTSDGTGLFYGEVTKDGMALKKLDIASGATSDLFVTHAGSYDVTFDISPDGNKIAFFDQVSGSMADGLYISKLDGSDRKLMTSQLQLLVTNPIWSPDGKWLMVNVWANSRWAFALVNVQDCRIIPLPWSADQVFTWIP